MYKVLIADDEVSVVEGLLEAIDWQAMNMEVVACVSNGREVLAEIEQHIVDVAILDIRMPGINGLEACAALRKHNEQLQIILISGYAEFSYAEKAIEYGVIGYCLKPLDYDKVKRCLRKAAINIEKTVRQAVKEDLLDAIDSEDAERISLLLTQVGVSDRSCYVVVTWGENDLDIHGNGVALEMGRNLTLYLTNSSFSEQERRGYLRKNGNRGLGWVPQRCHINELRKQMKRCVIQAFQGFIEPQEMGCAVFDENDANEIIQSVAEHAARGRWDLVRILLKNIEQKHAGVFNIRTAQKLWNTVYSCSMFRELEQDEYMEDYRQLIVEFGNFQKMLRQLSTDIQHAQVESGNAEYTNTAFMKLLSYISEHYRDDISLSSAGQALHMNPNYVSQLFKKESGETFTHYITQLRMNDALRMLATTDLPVIHIAMEVGFNDYFYFLKLFKRLMHKTPSQYRQDETMLP